MNTKFDQTILFLTGLLITILLLSGCRSSISQSPVLTTEPSVLSTAQKYIQDGQYEQALMVYNQQIQSGKNLDVAYAERGDYYTLTRNFDLALSDYTTSLGIKKSAVVLIDRCNVYQLLSEYDRAITDCTEAAKLDPMQADADIVLSLIYVDQNQLDQARTSINLALQIDPQSAKAYYVLSQIEINSKNLDKAVDDLTKALQIDPTNVTYFWQRGFLYLSLAKIDAAKADMNSVLKYGNPNVDGQVMQQAGSELRALGENP